MTSGKKARAKRRAAAPPPPVKKKGAGRQASPVVLGSIAGVIVLVVIAVVLAIVLTRGSSKSSSGSGSTSTTAALPGAAAVNAVFTGVPQSGTTLGSPNAPVTLREFIDLQCPFCDQFERTVFPTIVRRYVRPGKLKVEMEPLAFIGPDSTRGQAAVLAAGKQNRAFNYAAQLYQNQGTENTGWLNDDMVKAAAASIPGINVDRLLSERNSNAVRALQQQANGAGSSITSTPTIFVGKSGTPGTQVAMKSPTDETTLVQAINSALSS
jgi:protein-disulfide isomerase